jgi:hypothetical protein
MKENACLICKLLELHVFFEEKFFRRGKRVSSWIIDGFPGNPQSRQKRRAFQTPQVPKIGIWSNQILRLR